MFEDHMQTEQVTQPARNLSSCAGMVPSDLFTLAEAAQQLPRVNGKRIHVSTLWRWCRRGIKGVRLEYVRVGRAIMVTHATLDRFFTELAKLDDQQSYLPDVAPSRRKRRPPSESHRQQSRQEAEATLRRAKILV